MGQFQLWRLCRPAVTNESWHLVVVLMLRIMSGCSVSVPVLTSWRTLKTAQRSAPRGGTIDCICLLRGAPQGGNDNNKRGKNELRLGHHGAAPHQTSIARTSSYCAELGGATTLKLPIPGMTTRLQPCACFIFNPSPRLAFRRKRWSHLVRQPAKVDSPMQRMIHHEDAETVFG